MQNFKLNEKDLLTNQDWTFPTNIAYGPGRLKEIGGHNPNTIAWTGTLFIPFIITLIFISKNKIQRFSWVIILTISTLGIVFTFSRAGLLSLFLSFLLTLFLLKGNVNYKIRLTPFIILGVVAPLFIFNLFSSSGIISSKRFISLENITSASFERLTWLYEAFYFESLHPHENISGNAHSSITTAIFDYGIIHFILIYLIMIYFLYLCQYISKYHENQFIKTICKGLSAAGFVAILNSIFGNNMFAASSVQIYWLILGYLIITKFELKEYQTYLMINAKNN